MDIHIPGLVPLWTTPIVSETTWIMPELIWRFIPSGSLVYWRVRGADLDVSPLNIIVSGEISYFYKP